MYLQLRIENINMLEGYSLGQQKNAYDFKALFAEELKFKILQRKFGRGSVLLNHTGSLQISLLTF